MSDKGLLDLYINQLLGKIAVDPTREYDTTCLQFYSLKVFLNELSYDIRYYDDVMHISHIGTMSGNPRYMSLKQAVSMYNGWFTRVSGDITSPLAIPAFQFPVSTWRAARDSKRIAQVTLQRHKKMPTRIHVADNYVEFLDDISQGLQQAIKTEEVILWNN